MILKPILKTVVLLLLVHLFHSAKAQDANNYVDVLHYDINLNITDFENQKIKGNTVISLFTETEGLNQFAFHLDGLSVDSVLDESRNHLNYRHAEAELSIFTPKKIALNDTIQFNIYYGGRPIQDKWWGGFFFQDGYAFNMGVGMASETKSYGQVWYPCVDDFREKAAYDFRITVKKEHSAVCSGEFVALDQNSDGTHTWHWREESSIPAYVTSVAVGEYRHWTQTIKARLGNLPADIYYKPDLKDDIKSSFKNLPACLHGFESHYGPYVWKRIGFVTVPFSSGAMEHNCNIAYPEYAVDGSLKRETLMAHELSHHWFGNLVTCATPADMWLNEGWASYSEALFKEFVYGRQAYRDYVRQNHANVLQNTHRYDGGYWPVAGVPSHLTYGSTVYDKGADMVHTLRSYMGDDLFFESIRSYLKENAYMAVSTEGFKNYMSEVSKIDLQNFFDDWIFEAGFPHFSAGNFSYTKTGKEYMVFIDIWQELKARENLADSVPLEIAVFDDNLKGFTYQGYMSGKQMTFEFPVDFEPVAYLLDPEAKISDASVHHYIVPDTSGYFKFEEEKAGIDIHNLSKNLLIEIRDNYVHPNHIPEKYNLLSENYWTVTGINSEKLKAGLELFLPVSHLSLTDRDDIVLLYRTHSESDWKSVNHEGRIKDSEYIMCLPFASGEYCPVVLK